MQVFFNTQLLPIFAGRIVDVVQLLYSQLAMGNTMKLTAQLWIVLGLLTWISSPRNLQAQASQFTSTEEQFHDLFITAGYSTAFGAALGAAFIGLTSEPGDNLHYVAVGASLGFIAGSMLGTYILVSPSLVEQNRNPSSTQLAWKTDTRGPTLGLHPIIDRHQGPTGFGASISFAN